MQVKPAVCCWVCKTYEKAPGYTVKTGWLPEGWRRTRRGYAGTVTICGDCTEAGRKYQKDEDQAWNEVADRLRLMDAMHKELNALCDWGDESFMHAYVHIGNVIKNLRADVSTERILREKAEANYAFMVKKAADQSLDGYRELGARCAQLEAERDEARSKLRGYETAPVHVAADVLRSRLRETAQILIEAVGADGPMDAEDAARKAVEVIEHHRECMRQAGLQAFMRGRSPGEVGDHLHGVLQSYTDKIADYEDLIEALEWAGRRGRERGE
jgi:hypothetical protein